MGFYTTGDAGEFSFEHQESLRRRRGSDSGGRGSNPVSVVSINVNKESGDITDLLSDLGLRESDDTTHSKSENSLTFILRDTDWHGKWEFLERVKRHLAEKGINEDGWSLEGKPATYDNPSLLPRTVSEPRYSDERQYFSDIVLDPASLDKDREVYLSNGPTSVRDLCDYLNSMYKHDPGMAELVKQVKVLYINIDLNDADHEETEMAIFDGNGQFTACRSFSSLVKDGKCKEDKVHLLGDQIAVIFANKVKGIGVRYDNSKRDIVYSVNNA